MQKLGGLLLTLFPKRQQKRVFPMYVEEKETALAFHAFAFLPPQGFGRPTPFWSGAKVPRRKAKPCTTSPAGESISSYAEKNCCIYYNCPPHILGRTKKDCIAAVLEGKVKKTVYRYVMANRLVPGEVPADLPFDHCYGFTIA